MPIVLGTDPLDLRDYEFRRRGRLGAYVRRRAGRRDHELLGQLAFTSAQAGRTYSGRVAPFPAEAPLQRSPCGDARPRRPDVKRLTRAAPLVEAMAYTDAGSDVSSRKRTIAQVLTVLADAYEVATWGYRSSASGSHAKN